MGTLTNQQAAQQGMNTPQYATMGFSGYPDHATQAQYGLGGAMPQSSPSHIEDAIRKAAAYQTGQFGGSLGNPRSAMPQGGLTETVQGNLKLAEQIHDFLGILASKLLGEGEPPKGENRSEVPSIRVSVELTNELLQNAALRLESILNRL